MNELLMLFSIREILNIDKKKYQHYIGDWIEINYLISEKLYIVLYEYDEGISSISVFLNGEEVIGGTFFEA